MTPSLTPSNGILQQEREEGYQAGLTFAREGQRQIDQMMLEEEFERGRWKAYKEAPSRFVWWLVGVVTAFGSFFIWWIL